MRLPILAASLLVAIVPAQVVSFTATTATPIVVEAQVGPQLQSATLPAGLLPPTTYLTAAVPSGAQGMAQVYLSCTLGQGLQPALSLHALANSYPLAGAAVSTTTHMVDLLIEVQASAAVLANLEVERVVTATAGAAAPLQRIDVGDDGTFEVTEFSTPGAGVPGIALGPQILPIRVQFEAGTTAAQGMESSLQIRFVAQNDLVITPAISGCTVDYLWALPSFQGRGIDFGVQPLLTGDLSVAVIGLGVQPTVVAQIYPGCVLLPSPDLVVFLPTGAAHNLALPATVRPLTFWVQGVVLFGSYLGTWYGDLTTTQGYRVDAH